MSVHNRALTVRVGTATGLKAGVIRTNAY